MRHKHAMGTSVTPRGGSPIKIRKYDQRLRSTRQSTALGHLQMLWLLCHSKHVLKWETIRERSRLEVGLSILWFPTILCSSNSRASRACLALCLVSISPPSIQWALRAEACQSPLHFSQQDPPSSAKYLCHPSRMSLITKYNSLSPTLNKSFQQIRVGTVSGKGVIKQIKCIKDTLTHPPFCILSSPGSALVRTGLTGVHRGPLEPQHLHPD